MIEIRGGNSANSGAEMMAIAAIEAVRKMGYTPSAVPNRYRQSFRLAQGLTHTVALNRFPRGTLRASRVVPPALRRNFSLTTIRDIEGVLDISGFAYSDSFPSRRTLREVQASATWKNSPYVFLPQSFGPFTDDARKKLTGALLNAADIVFARDVVSLEHLAGLKLSTEVQLAPDVTIGLTPQSTPAPHPSQYALVVPSAKFFEMSSMSEMETTDALAQVQVDLERRGIQMLILAHEVHDRKLANILATRLSTEALYYEDALAAKDVIRQSSLLVSARFHALVSGLSQGVPTIGLGWSHKYAELFRTFHADDFMVNSPDELRSAVQDALEGFPVGAALQEAERKKVDLTALWARVASALGRPPATK